MADTLLNPQLLDDFIRATAGQRDVEVVARIQQQMREERGKSWRRPTAEELKAIDKDGAIELQAELLGRRFYMFDAWLDAGLEDEIAARAKKIEAELAEKKISARDGLRARQAAKMLSIRNAAERAERRIIIPLVNPLQIAKIDRALGYAVPGIRENGAWRDESEKDSTWYFGAFDGDSKVKALLQLSIQPQNRRTLMFSRSGPDLFPDQATNLYVAQYMEAAGAALSGNSGDTGLTQSICGKIIPLGDLPDEFTPRDRLVVSGTNSGIDFGPAQKIFGPAGAGTLIRNCPGLRSLGLISHCANTLHIEDCRNFSDIGALKTVGPVNSGNGADLILRNCKKLHSISGLEEVYGDLDLRGTSVKNIPLSLRKIRGVVRTDAGTFRFAGQGSSMPLVPCNAIDMRLRTL
jgi:hypothetical protein